ncbi:excinuclease ABC subunit UvrC [Aeromonas sp. BIGb0445]|jgi:excinuclease ABC subunit C|uniref:excinuclease ABC subunit UvrC n=1 Tax=Aeromonas sp. BIGb0445 TaxID=2940593 RepID=UPI002167F03D|nr:excinuclease ABC subunit UvrC [Aeromonas sp. BIGb0445]MCS3459250.1 excinuclease ABC subunit C [Aeromonas sp. BIGb0445]
MTTSPSSSSSFDSKAFLKVVSHQSGVYRMYDSGGTVIYVGKAKDLKKRLASYFRSKVDSIKTRTLVRQISDIQVTVTHTETEALILEHNLIKQYQPRYNVLLRDDKSYPWIVITGHRHPRIGLHRGARKLKGDYFGPYPSGGAVRESLHLMQKIFPVRQCEDAVYANRSRPCLLYQLKRCAGPCVAGLVSEEEYAQQVELARLFLAGKNQQVIGSLVGKMESASGDLRFEEAARYRDQIQALRKVTEQQSVSGNVLDELDVVGVAFEQGTACIHVLFIRQGKVLGSRSYFPKVPADTDLDEVVQSFLLQFYLSGQGGRQIPSEVLLDVALEDEALIADTLSQTAGYKVRVQSRTRAERARFIKLAAINAQSALRSRLAHQSTMAARLAQLEELLELDGPINRMECFDISHTMGERTVASCVVFNREGPFSAEYRRFNIEGITGGDDYAAMEQVLERRFGKQQEPDKVPDVLFIDGGLGQLRRAEEILARQLDFLGGKHPLLIGIAKGVTRKAGLETLIMGESHEELHLPADMPALHLIQHIRDESHRFAITGHRARRAKARTTSTLEEIPGVGPKRRQALLKYLGGLQEVKKASIDDLARVPGISTELAQAIHEALHGH